MVSGYWYGNRSHWLSSNTYNYIRSKHVKDIMLLVSSLLLAVFLSFWLATVVVLSSADWYLVSDILKRYDYTERVKC